MGQKRKRRITNKNNFDLLEDQNMNSRLLYSKIYKDEFFSGLPIAEKFLFIYFLTNENVNIIHLYEITAREIVFDTSVSMEELENAKNKFHANKKFYFYKNFVYITNANRYQRFTGDTNEKAKQTLFSQLSKDVLDWFYSISDTPQIPPRYPLKSKSYKKPKLNDDEEVNIDEIDRELQQIKTLRN